MSQAVPGPVSAFVPAPDPAPHPTLVIGRPRVVTADRILHTFTASGAVLILVLLVSLVSVLTVSAVPSMRAFGLRFLVDTDWRPNEIEQPVRTPGGQIQTDENGDPVTRTIPPAFGALPVIWGTVVSSIIALVFAVPLSLGASLLLVRVAMRWITAPASFLIEFLAAIPSIAYGLWGLFVMCPVLQQTIEPRLNRILLATPGLHGLAVKSGGTTGRDMLAGGLILAVMIIPIITAISRDVLRNVPRAQVEGTVALGATWWQSGVEMLKYSRSGLFGAVMLGLARAAGETMAITMVIGNSTQIKASLFAPAQTMSSLLANQFAEASSDLHRAALTEVALILLAMSLGFNVVARYLVVGKQSRSAAAH